MLVILIVILSEYFRMHNGKLPRVMVSDLSDNGEITKTLHKSLSLRRGLLVPKLRTAAEALSRSFSAIDLNVSITKDFSKGTDEDEAFIRSNVISSSAPVGYLASARSSCRSRLESFQNLRVSRLRADSWLDVTPECARGLEWDDVFDFRSPNTQVKWEAVTPLTGSPARRLFSWNFDDDELTMIETDVFPLKDLDSGVSHRLTAKEYDYLPYNLRT